MSTATTRMPLATAQAVAAQIVAQLQSYCERAEVAGSIRRQASEVGDVEVVVIARVATPPGIVQTAMFGEPEAAPAGTSVNLLAGHLEALEATGAIRRRPDKNGRRGGLNRITWLVDDVWVPVDLFRAMATTWGWQMVLRTGPAEFSHRLVTARAAGGWRPNDMQFDKGCLWRYPRDGRGAFGPRVFVPTPDEATLFAELGLPFVAPEARTSTTFDGVRR